MKATCIINPIAGKEKAIRIWRQAYARVARHYEKIDFEFTAHPGHATELARQAAKEKRDIVIAVGGDGTLNEVVNGLAGSDTALAIIPGGSGNDYAAQWGYPLSISNTVDMVLQGCRKKVDLARINGRYFLNIAGIGFDAEVARRVNGAGSKRGRSAYSAAIVHTLFSFRPINVEITIDGIKHEDCITMIAVGNGCYVGGGIKVLPDADPADGLLDICLIKEAGKIEILKTLPLVRRGGHRNHDKCRFFRGKRVIITPLFKEQTVYAQADGEILSGFPLDIEILPHALEIIVPARG